MEVQQDALGLRAGCWIAYRDIRSLELPGKVFFHCCTPRRRAASLYLITAGAVREYFESKTPALVSVCYVST